MFWCFLCLSNRFFFSEAANALKVNDDLRLKLQEAEASSFENAKEIDLLKNESLKKDTEVQSLIKEKDSLEENILFLTEEISKHIFFIYQAGIKDSPYYIYAYDRIRSNIYA